MSTNEIRISKELAFPLELVTQTAAILAKRGAGKSYTASVIVEGMVEAHLPVVVVDPVGSWWGLRFAANGKGPGLPVVILGGDHGDLPLEPTGGEVIADFAIDSRQPIILDLSRFTKGEARRFMTDFAERLYHRNRDAMHVVLDEADSFIPQRVDHGGERLVGAVNDLVRRGRARGIGVTLISQRPALVNKDVLTQIEVLVALRMTAPQDRDAIERWVEHNADQEQAKKLLSTLVQLPIGTAWIWSPGWLGICERVAIAKRRTFDSSATPTAGAKRVSPMDPAAVDLETLRSKLSATIEKAKEEDPKELRRTIAALRAELAKRPTTVDTSAIAKLEAELARERVLGESYRARLGKMLELAREVVAESAPPAVVPSPPAPAPPRVLEAPPASSANGAVKLANSASKLGGGERKILAALAQHGTSSKQKLAILTRYAASGGGFSNYLGSLRSRGLIAGGADAIAITDVGVHELGAYEPLPMGEQLLEYWYSELSRAERLVLQALARAHPHALSKEGVAKTAGYEASGGGFSNALGRLRTLGLIEGKRDLRASEHLFARGQA